MPRRTEDCAALGSSVKDRNRKALPALLPRTKLDGQRTPASLQGRVVRDPLDTRGERGLRRLDLCTGAARRGCRKGVSEVVTHVEMGHDRGHPRGDLRAATLKGVKRRPNSRNHWRLLPSARRESCGAISACSGSFSRRWDRSSARAGCSAPCMPRRSPGLPPSSPGYSEAAS